MKNLHHLVLLPLFFFACSNFKEDMDMDDLHYDFAEVETRLPVINITADQKEFDNMYQNYDQEIEIEATFDLYRDKILVIQNEKVALQIKGNYSARYDLKSIGVKFDKKIDNSGRTLLKPEHVLPFHSIDKIKSIRLRNSGSDFKNTMLKDLSFTQLAINAGLDVDLTYGEPSLVYINEVFYGLLNIRTESNTHGVAGLNSVSKDDITMVEVTTHQLFIKDGDSLRVNTLLDAISRKDIPHLKREIDLSNFTDYMIYESYLANTDSPHNNCRFYAVKDGQFRFILFDLDKVSWLKLEKAPLTIIEDRSRPNVVTDLFFALYEDEDFQNNFWNRYKELLESSSISPAQLRPIVYKNRDNIQQEMLFQIKKYGDPGSSVEWRLEIDKLLQLFEEREAVVELAIRNLEG